MLETIQQYPFICAFIFGLVPALIWLWFWLKEDVHPEPVKMITLSFVGGMIAVALALPAQKLLYPYVIHNDTLAFSVFATIEELFKLGIVYLIALRSTVDDEPIDKLIYLIISALGFVALENTLFLFDPIKSGDIIKTIIAGNMRFMGASLVHIIASGTIGIWLALSFYKQTKWKRMYLTVGILMAIILHTIFNLTIINIGENNILFLFGAVWVGIITILLLSEKIKHLKQPTA
jgi:RsiW-degrading membrane proteinase PrsW (M82 family)